MIKKILIANRGEIALRIVRACRELGIRSVAVYTDADQYALHVKRADEAISLGPESLTGYLNLHRIVNAALTARCDAIHPGYGFQSENPEFPALCKRSGLIFIGPNERVMKLMGDKVFARRAMQEAGIAVIPGSEGHIATLDEARQCAKRMGYPIMVKASGGGGGRGLRLCRREEDLPEQFERAQSEALRSFGNSQVFIEKYIENPRHIEVQILGDAHGQVVHLFERDCSIQRRHQKLIEIAPSPQITVKQRKELCECAVRAAAAIGYENAGTVEFIVDQKGHYYFLEMNTRIQVEHPVTEQITGIDLVVEQIKIAAGKPLSFTQRQIKRRGFAIEFRINAEDPQNDFLPSIGTITRYYAPGGPGVRTDSAMYTGYRVPGDYDSLLAKLTVWALDWPSVIERSRRALSEMRMHGVKTTIPYYLEIISHPDFIKKRFDTTFVEQHLELTKYSNHALHHHQSAVIAAALALHWGL